MNRVEDLITRFCPEGVEFKPLGEIGELVRGNGLPKTDFANSGVGAIHYGQIYTYYGTWTTETISFVAPETAAKLTKVDPGDIVITNTSENVEDVGKAVAWLGSVQVVTGGHATVLKHNQEPKYLAYWFQSPSFQAQKRRLATGTKVIDVSAKELATVKIPVPPIEVQREIVRVLDVFQAREAELEADLEAELEARAVQYAHYRDALLSFGESAGVRRAPMGEVGEFFRGRRFTKNDIVDDGVGCIHYGEIYTYYGTSATTTLSRLRRELSPTLRFARTGDVVIASVGETVEDVGKAVAWLGAEDVAVHDDCFVFRHELSPEFVSYFTQTADFHGQLAKYVARAKVKRISGESLTRIVMPVPPLEVQERIVRILDRLDALAKALSSGLPAELRARRKQYEHYRDGLLTFKELTP